MVADARRGVTRVTMTDVTATRLLPAVALRPVREGQAFEATLEQLARAIRLGLIPQATSLPPERELAEKLGVSRVTLREAMASLRDMGMVTTRRGRGGGSIVTYDGRTVVGFRGSASSRSAKEVADVLAYRRIIESGAAAAAATVAGEGLLSQDDATFLRECCDQTELASHLDPGQHRVADSRFHIAIAGVSGNQWLVESMTRVHDVVHELLCSIPVLPRNIEHSNTDHSALVEAILDGDVDEATAVIEEHCDKTAALLRGLLG